MLRSTAVSIHGSIKRGLAHAVVTALLVTRNDIADLTTPVSLDLAVSRARGQWMVNGLHGGQR